ncbi:MAG: 2-hydroxychromene-2-carboxylate isomerase [Lentilitoribacter sp.]
MTNSKLTFWFDFASTYSYLAAMRIQTLATRENVEIIWRPFLLGPIFKSQGLETSPFNVFEVKGRHVWRDLERQANYYDLPAFTKPEPFPQNGLIPARIAAHKAAEPWAVEFIKAIFVAQFTQSASITDELIIGVLSDLEQDGENLLNQAKTDQSVKDKLRQATEEAQSMGLFGAPSFITDDGELFWGNDRLEQALDWTKKPQTFLSEAYIK